MTTHEALVAGRNLLARRGWGQGIGSDPRHDTWTGRYCAEAAIEAVSPPTVSLPAKAFLCDLIAYGELYDWNDESGRRVDEVLALFDQGIALTAPEPFVDLEIPELVLA